MPVESATTIEELNSSWPLEGESAGEGDDHIRGPLKSMLKAQFFGVAGDKYDIPLTAGPRFLNGAEARLDTAESEIQALEDVQGNYALKSHFNNIGTTPYLLENGIGVFRGTANGARVLVTTNPKIELSNGADSVIYGELYRDAAGMGIRVREENRNYSIELTPTAGSLTDAYTITADTPQHIWRNVATDANLMVLNATSLNVVSKKIEAISDGVAPTDGVNLAQVQTLIDLARPKSFESTEIAVAAGAVAAQAHGLGGMPQIFQGFLRCKVSEYGYNVGDEIVITGQEEITNTAYGASVFANATNVAIQQVNTGANVFNITNRLNPFGRVAITAANWAVVLRATLIQ